MVIYILRIRERWCSTSSTCSLTSDWHHIWLETWQIWLFMGPVELCNLWVFPTLIYLYPRFWIPKFGWVLSSECSNVLFVSTVVLSPSSKYTQISNYDENSTTKRDKGWIIKLNLPKAMKTKVYSTFRNPQQQHTTSIFNTKQPTVTVHWVWHQHMGSRKLFQHIHACTYRSKILLYRNPTREKIITIEIVYQVCEVRILFKINWKGKRPIHLKLDPSQCNKILVFKPERKVGRLNFLSSDFPKNQHIIPPFVINNQTTKLSILVTRKMANNRYHHYHPIKEINIWSHTLNKNWWQSKNPFVLKPYLKFQNPRPTLLSACLVSLFFISICLFV